VVVVALAVGSSRSDGPASDEERVQQIAASVRCPTCRGQSVASSDAPAAEALRAEISRRVEAGEGDDEVRAALVAAYGDGILLNPPASGVAGLVWVLPVAGVVVALGALVLGFRRWRPAVVAPATDEDRDVVARARAQRGATGDAGDARGRGRRA
jgi:cytochrome c-type biogenesis protein CcmH